MIHRVCRFAYQENGLWDAVSAGAAGGDVTYLCFSLHSQVVPLQPSSGEGRPWWQGQRSPRPYLESECNYKCSHKSPNQRQKNELSIRCRVVQCFGQCFCELNKEVRPCCCSFEIPAQPCSSAHSHLQQKPPLTRVRHCRQPETHARAALELGVRSLTTDPAAARRWNSSALICSRSR